VVFKFVIVPFYDKYLIIKSKFSKKTTSHLEKLILIFTNRYVIHILIIGIAIGVATSNIMAYESSEDYGQDALIYDIISMETYDIGEDIVMNAQETTAKEPLGETIALTRNFFTENQKQQEDILEQQLEADSATTQGGSVLIKPELASTEAAKITRTSIREYTVEEGDSIGSVATDFNISVNTLLWANNLSFNSLIRPGKKLVVPPTSGVLHTIKKGDTIKSIAKKYGATENKIKDFSNIGSGDILVVGETIMVPGGRVIYTVPTRNYASTVTTPVYTTPNVASGGQMYWPSGCRRITQYYRGWIHTGLDIACGFGEPLRASEAGTVSAVNYNRYGYGYHVIINHGGGKQTLYGHMSRIHVKVGQQVAKAQVIGLEGSTGRSTGAHLHFEVRINGSRLNPLNYIR